MLANQTRGSASLAGAAMIEFLSHLKRRKLVQWALAYVAFAFALLQGVDIVATRFDWPGQFERLLIVALAVGFLLTVVLAWYHGERGAQTFSGAEVLILALLLALGGGLLWWFDRAPPPRSAGAPSRSIPDSAAASGAIRPVPIPAKSIAVLPFVNMSGDAKNDYFSDGITEEILNALAQVPNLKVAARTSAFAFKGKEEDLRKVGEVLDVATVLEGSVQKSGGEVRITAPLIDTRTGYHLWSEKYDRKLTSIFGVEDEISRAIAEKLRVQLVGGSGQALIRHATEDPQAHALYLRAISDIARRGPALKDAVLLLQQATSRDPGYASAWGGLSQTYELLPWYDLGEWRRSLADAERAANRALALDPQSGEAHAAIANVLRDRLEYAAADREYRKALTLSPGSSEIHNQFAQLMGAVEAYPESLQQERIAISLDPLAPNPRYFMGSVLLSLRRYPEAIAAFNKVLEQTPDYVQARFLLASANLFAGRYEDARKVARAAALQAGQDPETVDALIQGCANPALRNIALQRVASLGRIGRQHGEFARAYWYGLLGSREQAAASLQHWVGHASSGELFLGIIFLSKPAFDPIRDDPRFEAVLAKLGLPWRPAGAD
jgi:TolB-like protein/Flp pilus assembly protein TadD